MAQASLRNKPLALPALCGLLLTLLALCPAPANAQAGFHAPPSLLRRLIQPGVNGQIQTVRGDTLRVDNFRLSTPEDFDAIPAGEALLNFASEPAPPDFDKIQKLTLSPLTTSWQGSRPDNMECYWLGNMRNAVPPPPDWKRGSRQIPPWKPARPTADPGSLPFLNHSIFCWAPPKPETDKDLGVYLFRQAFTIERAETIVRATLRIATNGEPLEGALNEYPLHLGGEKPFAIAEFEITPLIQGGLNILALKLRERPGIPPAACGLAFNLELVTREPGVLEPPTLDPTATLITSTEGDRVWGWVDNLRADRALLDTTYGLYSLEWGECPGLLFPAGWHAKPPKRGLMEKVFTPPPLPSVDLKRFGLPLAMLPQSLQNTMLLTEGRTTTAKPSHMMNDTIYFEGDQGQSFSMPLTDVLGIYPPRPTEASFKRPRPNVGILYCHVATTSGEVLCGLIRDLTSERLVLESSGGQILAIKSDRISSILFPYHAATLGPAVKPGPIGILPQASGKPDYRNAWESDARHVQAACFAINAECRSLPNQALASTDQLTPKNFPVLVSVDPVGEYLHSMNAPADAQEALVNYLDQGGTLIVLSRGGALRTAIKNEGGQLIGAVSKPSLTELLQVRIVRPTDPAAPPTTATATTKTPPAGIKPFDHPPNTVDELYCQRTAALPGELAGLPQRIDLAPMLAAPYYPLVAPANRATVVYDLTDAAGAFYGPALSIVSKGQGTLIVIDHLLWESRIDNQPFSERVLPVLMHWSLARTK